jgi:hypothetical protein
MKNDILTLNLMKICPYMYTDEHDVTIRLYYLMKYEKLSKNDACLQCNIKPCLALSPTVAPMRTDSVLSLERVDQWNPIQSRSRPMGFLGFSKHEKGAPRQEISK